MKLYRTKPVHSDKRGTIWDLHVGQTDAINYITFAEGAIRGNHVHENTAQGTHLLSGKLSVRVETSQGSYAFDMGPGDTILLAPGEAHAFKAIVPSRIITWESGPRAGEQYESDTKKLDHSMFGGSE
jgi:quercetin dioxygenase-like cupin family protein